MGPFQGFGPNWDQVPNSGHHYEHCSCYLDFFFSETKFSETETETFFQDQIFSKPKLRLFFRNQIFRNRNPQRFSKSFETEKFWNRNVNLCHVHIELQKFLPKSEWPKLVAFRPVQKCPQKLLSGACLLTCHKSVVLRVVANLIQWNMQYVSYNSAFLAPKSLLYICCPRFCVV